MSWAALTRFHLGVGVRVALRSLVPVAVAAVAAAVVYGSPAAVVGPLAVLLFPAPPGLAPGLLAVALAFVIARAAAPRLTPGVTGYLRHLPASAVVHRRALTAGLVVAQAPLLGLVAVAGWSVLAERPMTTLPRLAGLLPLAWAAALAALRVERAPVRVVAGLAGAAAWTGSWLGLALASALVVTADATAGPLAPGRGRRGGSRRVGRRPIAAWPIGSSTPLRLSLAIARRALGWRLVTAWLAGPLTLLPAALFLRNNSLTTAQQLIAVRLAGVAAAALVMAALADALVKRRPPWPWVRSLPWTSGRRTAYDAVLLAGAALPVVVAAGAILAAALWHVLAVLPVLALRGAAAIRQGSGRMSGASGQLLAEGMLAAALTALVPWAAFALLGLTPLAARLAAASERRQDVSRWHELHHLAAGDPLSWSDR